MPSRPSRGGYPRGGAENGGVSDRARRARAARRRRPARRAGRRGGARRGPRWPRSCSAASPACAAGPAVRAGARRSDPAAKRRRRRPSRGDIIVPRQRGQEQIGSLCDCRIRSVRSQSAPDDGVRDGDAEALLGVGEALVLAVVAVALGVREDHDAVGRERRERVLERDRGLGLAGVAGGVDAVLLEPLDGLLLRRSRPRRSPGRGRRPRTRAWTGWWPARRRAPRRPRRRRRAWRAAGRRRPARGSARAASSLRRYPGAAAANGSAEVVVGDRRAAGGAA